MNYIFLKKCDCMNFGLLAVLVYCKFNIAHKNSIYLTFLSSIFKNWYIYLIILCDEIFIWSFRCGVFLLQEFLTLLGQIFIISFLQMLIELFIDSSSKPYQARVMNVACFLGCLYFLINYIATTLLTELASIFNFSF